ncbi:MAG: hypothetical protein R3F56_03040 [Planctomycetota bacterium]
MTRQTRFSRPALASLVLCLLGLCLLGFAALCVTDAPTAPGTAAATERAAPSTVNGIDAAETATSARTAVPGAMAPFGAPAGSRFVFDTSSSTATSMVRAGEPITDARSDVRGLLQVVVLARRGDECIAALHMPEPSVSGKTSGRDAATVFARLARDLELGCLVRLRACGTPLGLRFDPAVTPSHRNRLRALVALLTFAVRDGAASWESDEPDATGLARVHYEWTTDRGQRVLRKAKTAYVAGTDGDPVPEVEHQARATFDFARGWLASAATREIVTLRVEQAAMVVRVATTASVTLATATVQAVTPDPSLWDGAWQPVAGVTDDADEDNERLAEERAMLAGLASEKMAQWLREELGKTPRDLGALLAHRRNLVRILQLWPERAQELERIILANLEAPELASFLISSVAEAGTPAAQRMLAGFAADGSLPEPMRATSLASMVQVAQPTTDLMLALSDLAASSGPARVTSTSMLMLGALAGRADEPRVHLDRLFALEPSVAHRSLLESWFSAIGNCGDPRCVEVAERHLATGDPALGAAALAALRHVSPPAGQSVLLAATHDAAAVVRVQAVDLLCQRIDAESIERVVAMTVADPDATVRAAARRRLVESAGNPAMRVILERLAAVAPTAPMRSLAATLLREGSS